MTYLEKDIYVFKTYPVYLWIGAFILFVFAIALNVMIYHEFHNKKYNFFIQLDISDLVS
jgi:hypothetical protein